MIQKFIKNTAGETIGLKKLFAGYDERLLHLLELMLEYNPALRPSAEQLIRHPIFDGIRVKKLEKMIKKCQTLQINIEGDLELSSANIKDLKSWRR